MEERELSNKIYETKGDRLFSIINYFLLTVALIIFAYPLIYVVSASFSSGSAVVTNKVWLWPVEFNLEGYKAVFKYRLIVNGFLNSFLYMIVGTILNLVMTILAGYPLSRKDFYGRNIVMLLFVFTMLFNGGLIPSYMLVKNLHMRNTIWAMIIPSAMSVWNVIITRTFFQQTIPTELLEASQLDGCNDFQFITKVVLPLSKPIIAVMALFYAVGHWNTYFNAMIYLDDPKLFPLQIVLRQILVMNTVDFSMLSNIHIDVQSEMQKVNLRELLKYSLVVVASVPVLIIYPFVQKYFVKGIMVGSVKG
jgi:putative aldouronate transport system permease protein